MFRWIPYAMVRITAFFAAGIAVGIQWPDLISPWTDTLTITLLFLYLITVMFLHRSRRLRIVSGVIGLAAVFAAGGAHVLNRTDARDPTHISHVSRPIAAYAAVVAGAPEDKPNSIRVEVEIEKVKCGNAWVPASGKCLVYLSKKQNPVSVMPGDQVFINGAPSVIPPPANPGEFDNKRFLSFKNICHQHFVRADGIHRVGYSAHRGLFYYSQRIRARASAIIQQFVAGKQNQVIARALVLGVTDGIDNELRGAYAASGAMHILSVSGLHVGIIYAIVVFLLRPLGHFSWSRWFVAAISLACLWSYAFITGLSPSVLRAVVMISFVVVARPLARDTNIYNTLAASAFLLLVFDPYLIMSVGFQLSYLAVAGILYLQRPLYHLWEAPTVFWDKVWQATSVSVAAQLATFSLGLFYFHQFPVYFLFSNLIVIPLSIGVLVIGVLLLVVSPIAWAASLVGLLLQYVIVVLNGVVFFVERLPFSVINEVTITGLQCGLEMGMIVLAIRLFETRNFKFLSGTFVLLVVFTVVEWRNLIARQNQEQLIVYRQPGHGAVAWIKGTNTYLHNDFADSPRYFRSLSGGRLYLFGKTTVLWIDRQNFDLSVRGAADFVIIGKDAVRSLDQLRRNVRFCTLILDSTNSGPYEMRIIREAESRATSVYSVGRQGAFIVNL